MLEVILIVFFTKHLAGKAAAKGRSGGWAALGPVMWIGGEIVGFLVGVILTQETMLAYGIALLGAAAGAGGAFLIVHLLSVAPGYEALALAGEDSRGMTCPSCGSLQTEVQGTMLECFNCNARVPVGGYPYPAAAPYAGAPYPPSGPPPPDASPYHPPGGRGQP